MGFDCSSLWPICNNKNSVVFFIKGCITALNPFAFIHFIINEIIFKSSNDIVIKITKN